MAITKQNNGTYMVDVSLGNHNGKRLRKRKKGIKKYKDAQEIEAKIRNNKDLEVKKEHILFEEAYLKYINFCTIEIKKGNMRNTTIESKKSIFENHILPQFKKAQVINITKDDILLFQKNLSQKKNSRISNKKLSTETLRKIYKQLHAFFEYCRLEEEFITINPCDRVNNFKKEKKEKEYLTIDEFNRLIKNIDNIRDKTIIQLLFFSGIRISELLGLSLDTINLNDADPYIKITNTCHKGKIRKYAKTEESKDIVFIDIDTKNIILKYIDSEEFKSYHTKYLFPSRDSNCGVLSEKSVTNMIKKYCNLANINKNITPHSFRHSHVALLISMGYNLEDIKDRLRHASIKTTSDEYGHMYNSRKKEIAKNITNYVKNQP